MWDNNGLIDSDIETIYECKDDTEVNFKDENTKEISFPITLAERDTVSQPVDNVKSEAKEVPMSHSFEKESKCLQTPQDSDTVQVGKPSYNFRLRT